MQLQRSLFSFYKVFIQKTPLCIWIGVAVILFCIIGWQLEQINNQQPVYDFQKCILQYYNATRSIQNVQKTEQAGNQNSEKTEQQVSEQQKRQGDKIPFNLTKSYFNILNKTSTIRVYLSDQITYQSGDPSCKIILNTQKINIKIPQYQKQQQKQKQPQKPITILQQISDQSIKIKDSQNKDNNGQDNPQKSQAEDKIAGKNPANVKNYDQVSGEQKKFLADEHPFMHLTANSHVVYLDQDNQFQEKHGIQIHSIILSKQNINSYPQTIFGISSRFWRFHGNEQIDRNSRTMLSLTQSFRKASNKIKQLYVNQLAETNMLRIIKKSENLTRPVQNGTQSQSNISADAKQVKIDQKSKQNTSPNQDPKQPLKQQAQKPHVRMLQGSVVGLTLIPFLQISPLAQMKIYFHYPQTLRYENIDKLVYSQQDNNGIIFKFFFLLLSYGQFLIISGLIGLLVRYLFFLIITFYLFLGGFFVNKQWGWVHKYFSLIRNRSNAQNNVSFLSSCKMTVMFTFALLGILAIFTFGSKFMITDIYINAMAFSQNFYSEMVLKNFFIIELFYYVCCRSRVTLRYFPILSAQTSLLVQMLCFNSYFYNVSWSINLHMWVHLLLMCIFAAFENLIGHESFYSDFTPSIERPRALYYIGYDISWENTLPPIWTYFTTHFDLKNFNQKQKALIDRDYQLLYGRLMGMNERQQLPEDEQSDQEQVHQLNQNLSQSNQMSLIR